METVMLYLGYVLMVVGGASAVAMALKPLIDAFKNFAAKTENTWDNKVAKYLGYAAVALVWLGEKLLPLLDGLALNPKSKDVK